jgi:outer membrane lipoprotein-sorting protein
MKRVLISFAAMALLTIFAACGAIQERVDANVYEQIHRQLLTMESFEAQATVTYISNNNSHTYETLQQARTTGEYRIEVTSPLNVAGNTTVYDGNSISQFNPQVDGRILQTITEVPERLEILLTSFVRNFIRSEETTVTASTTDETKTTVLEAPIPGEHPYLSLARLWVSNDSLKPVQMVIYDAVSTERIVIIYNSFEYNVDLDDNIFKAQATPAEQSNPDPQQPDPENPAPIPANTNPTDTDSENQTPENPAATP